MRKETYRQALVKMHELIEDELFRVESGGVALTPAEELQGTEIAYAVDWAYALGIAVGTRPTKRKRI